MYNADVANIIEFLNLGTRAVTPGGLRKRTRIHPGMRLLAAAKSVPKAGRSDDENEDAFELDDVMGRYAVADGVSTAARPEVWSQLLVHAFVSDELSSTSRGHPAGPIQTVA